MSEYTPTTEEVRTDYIMAYTERQSPQLLAGLAFDRWHAAELAAADKRGAVRALREFADVQDSWCEAGRDEQIISRRAMRDALRARADQIEEEPQ